MNTISMEVFWYSVIILSLGTFALRFSFIYMMDKITFPGPINKMLKFIPVSVLPAIVVPAIAFEKSTAMYSFDYLRIAAGVIAAAIAWKTKNMLLTIALGMVSLWLLSLLMQV